MTRKRAAFNTPGPFRADQLKPGDPYELSGGHPIECLPAGVRGSRTNLIGAALPKRTALRGPDCAIPQGAAAHDTASPLR